jgi:predicted GIY-YIG superfamily endonuclease
MTTATVQRTALYRFFDADHQLLYVGITSDPETRWKSHGRYAASTWWPKVHSKTMHWFDDRTEAVAAELKAIRSESPLYNMGGAPSRLRVLAPGEALCPMRSTELFWKSTDEFQSSTAGPWHMWEAVAGTLAKDLAAERYVAALPSVRELVNRFGVSQGTVGRAIKQLSELGLVEITGRTSARRYLVIAKPIQPPAE